jgi:hypothetical protein
VKFRSAEVHQNHCWEEDAWRSICNSGTWSTSKEKGVGMFETLEHVEVPEVDHSRRSQRDTWCSICNFWVHGVLRRKKMLECLKLPNVKVSKWITVVDHEGMCGARSVTLGMKYFEEKCVGMFENPECRSPEVDHIHRSQGIRGARFVTMGMEYFRGKRCWNV